MALGFMFAGQGAQKVGMASETVSDERVRQLFDIAEKKRPGIVELMLNGSQDELNRTLNTQPAMFLADLAYAYVKEKEAGPASAVCGFSVGEIPALVYAGALSESDGFDIICERARLMDEACGRNGGKMIAVIGLDPEKVEELASSVPECWAVNYNAPKQTVVAVGNGSADVLLLKAKELGARAIPLKVSGAFHCPYMKPASEGLEKLLQTKTFVTPKIPVYANLTGMPYAGTESEMKELLFKQVCSPVRFTLTVKNMREAGITEFCEVGPGNVLGGLIAKM